MVFWGFERVVSPKTLDMPTTSQFSIHFLFSIIGAINPRTPYVSPRGFILSPLHNPFETHHPKTPNPSTEESLNRKPLYQTPRCEARVAGTVASARQRLGFGFAMGLVFGV